MGLAQTQSKKEKTPKYYSLQAPQKKFSMRCLFSMVSNKGSTPLLRRLLVHYICNNVNYKNYFLRWCNLLHDQIKSCMILYIFIMLCTHSIPCFM